ncbi:MAG TPA: M42 family metallopeptidase [candidate division Zixibacteria bacterium]|nr:M42 family metallopeptidase [candidate division Zixibacteria bacterium]
MDLKIDQLEKWTNGFGPSGFELEVAKMVKEYVSQFADEVNQDKTGSLIFKKGTKGPKIMLAGHIDEIGFIVSGINNEGFLSFKQLGGWWDQVLLGHRVIIKVRDGTKIKGLICSKPPHVLKPEDRTKVLVKDDMFIDVGCKSKKELEYLGIKIGDPIIPDATFELVKRKQFITDEESKETTEKEVTLAIGKAFDDRIGMFIISEVFRKLKEEKIAHPNQLFGVATTQEEVGLRGARTSAQIIQPDVGFALEVDISSDIPGFSKNMTTSEMSKGPSILTADSSMIPNPQLKHFIIDVAKEKGIDLQLSMLFGGGTDAGVMHITGAGCPSICIGIPTRHIHSHYGILDLEDVEKAINLLVEVVKRLDQETVDSFTKI